MALLSTRGLTTRRLGYVFFSTGRSKALERRDIPPFPLIATPNHRAATVYGISDILSLAGAGPAKQEIKRTMKISPKVWRNGEFIDWDDARIHVMSHVVNYGSSVFEGIRCYNTSKGSAVFRLTEHMQRLANSAKIYRMDSPSSRRSFVRRRSS